MDYIISERERPLPNNVAELEHLTVYLTPAAVLVCL